MEKYISVVETAERWNVSPRRIQILCNENRIKGAKKQSGTGAQFRQSKSG